MVAQPDTHPRTAAPSAITMASNKRDAPEDAKEEDAGRSFSVKSTRMSEANIEMISPTAPIGDFAALAATPATSVALAAEQQAPVPKRTRGGARSVPPALDSEEDSPARRARDGAPDPATLELRQLANELSRSVKKTQVEQARDRMRIVRLEGS